MNIIIVGYSGSGKSTIADYLVKKYGFKKYEISYYVIEEFKRQNEYDTPLEYCDYLFSKGELSKFIYIVLNSISQHDKNRIFVGPRTISEINLIKEKCQDAIIIGILSSVRIRKKRSVSNKEKKVNNCDLITRDRIEGKWGLETILNSYCDYTIENNGNYSELINKIEDIINYQKRREKWEAKGTKETKELGFGLL